MKVNNEVFYKNDIFLWSPLLYHGGHGYRANLRGLSLAELTDITAEARQALMTKVSEHGGHFGPPMGAAEMIMTNPLQSSIKKTFTGQCRLT